MSFLTIDKAREMYRNDPEFNQLVHLMVASIEKLQFTPAEMRAAATFASLVVEERSSKKVFLFKGDV